MPRSGRLITPRLPLSRHASDALLRVFQGLPTALMSAISRRARLPGFRYFLTRASWPRPPADIWLGYAASFDGRAARLPRFRFHANAHELICQRKTII